MKIWRFTAIMMMSLASVTHAREQGAHVHGAGQLSIAVDGNLIEVELSAPLDSLVGFERPPRTEREKKAVDAMRARFMKPDTLFSPTTAAGCTAAPAKLSAPVLDAKEAKPGKTEDGHAELQAMIAFRCESAAALKDIEVRLFDAFSGLHKLSVQVASPRGQRSATLTPKRRVISW
jgi:hypothetical protein